MLRPRSVETTALGAAYLAGLAVGYWSGPEDIRQNWAVDRVFDPQLPETHRAARLAGWQRAVNSARGWSKAEE